MLQIDPGRPPTPPKDAATVMLLRERAGGGFEIFMVRRHTKSGFMGGAYVFPGGKLDADDSSDAVLDRVEGRTPLEAAQALGEGDDPRRAAGLFVAAVRETFEEAGVLLADTEAGADLAAARRRLEEGAPFGDVLAALSARLRLDRVVPWARWVTPAVEPRRYDTRFFLAVAPAEQEAAHDRRETTEAAWMAPTEALERECRGEIQLPPPTLRNLELLRELESVDSVLRLAAGRTPPYVDPVFLDAGGVWVLALPGDPGHPTRERAVEGPTRFTLRDGRWISGDLV